MSEFDGPILPITSQLTPVEKKILDDMASPLTREQVEKAFLGLYHDQHIKANIGVTTTLILLQSHIAQQAQEIERLTLANEMLKGCVAEESRRLAAAQARVKELEELENQTQQQIKEWAIELGHPDGIVSLGKLKEMLQATLTAQERVKELEDEVSIADKLIAERDRVLDLLPCEKHGRCAPHAIEAIDQLQTTLAARERRIAELEGEA